MINRQSLLAIFLAYIALGPLTAAVAGSSVCPPGMEFITTEADPVGGCHCFSNSAYKLSMTVGKNWLGECDNIEAPVAVNGLKLWLDADDASTITADGSSVVSQWNDKSGNGLHVSQSTASVRPTRVANAQNNRRVLRFDGNDGFQRTSVLGSSLSASNEISVFFVAKQSTLKYSSMVYWDPTGFCCNYLNIHAVWSDDLSFYFDHGAWGRISAFTPDFTNIWGITSAVRRTDNTQKAWLNGQLRVSGANAVAFPAASSGTLNIGSAANPAVSGLGGDMAEILIYNRGVTNSERFRIEEYLAGKWWVSVFKPSTVSGLQLWFDANDIDGDEDKKNNMADGALVGTWKDKSGNARHATATGSLRPVYAVDSLNGRPVLRFTGTQYLAIPYNAAINPAAMTIYIVLKPTGGAGTYRSPLTSREASNPLKGYAIYADTGNNWSILHSVNNVVWDNFTNGAAPVNQVKIFGITMSGTSRNGYLNGVAANPAASPGNYVPNSSRETRIGAGVTEGAADYYFYGDIAEVLLYNKVVSASERALIEDYLNSKWGVY